MRQEQTNPRLKEVETLKHEAYKRKQDEKKSKEKTLHVKLQKLKSELAEAQETIERAMMYVDQGGKKIGDGLKVSDLMDIEA